MVANAPKLPIEDVIELEVSNMVPNAPELPIVDVNSLEAITPELPIEDVDPLEVSNMVANAPKLPIVDVNSLEAHKPTGKGDPRSKHRGKRGGRRTLHPAAAPGCARWPSPVRCHRRALEYPRWPG